MLVGAEGAGVGEVLMALPLPGAFWGREQCLQALHSEREGQTPAVGRHRQEKRQNDTSWRASESHTLTPSEG